MDELYKRVVRPERTFYYVQAKSQYQCRSCIVELGLRAQADNNELAELKLTIVCPGCKN